MSCDFTALALAGVRGLQPYQPGKPVEELERELGISEIVKLASNENPLGPSSAVAEALREALPELARYPDGSAYALKRKLAAHLGVQEDMLTIGNGSNDVLELIGRAFLHVGAESIVSQHAFVVYPLVTRAIGAALTVIPASDFGQDLVATRAAIKPSTRCIFIANPNNPTGTWIARDAFCGFLAQVPEDVLVVLDEAYFEYVAEPDYPDGVSLLGEYPNLIVTRTFSKAYGLAALRVGYAVSNPQIADILNRIRQPFNVNSLALVAAAAALGDQPHIQRSAAANAEGMALLRSGCDELGIGYVPSAGNFLTIDVGQDATPVYGALLREGVIVRPIGVYEMPQHLRVTVGTESENQRFLSALTTVLG